MELADYFENIKGTGILATSDTKGNVDSAIYARPYVIDNDTIAFSMLERLTYANILENPKACYTFIEKGEGHKGKRLYLVMEKEETDAEKIKQLRSKHNPTETKSDVKRHIMYFKIKSVRPLIGD